MGYYQANNLMSKHCYKNIMTIGSFFNFLYITVYLFPVTCKAKNTGICNHGFVGFLLCLFALVGGVGTTFSWIGKECYIRKCSDAETDKKHHTIFSIIFGFAGILASLFALSLLANETVRTGLFVILTILAFNAVIIQACKSDYNL